MEDNNITYAQAIAELEQIVEKMQQPDCDIDSLSKLTARSKELLDFCRKRLLATDEELHRILEDKQPE